MGHLNWNRDPASEQLRAIAAGLPAPAPLGAGRVRTIPSTRV